MPSIFRVGKRIEQPKVRRREGITESLLPQVAKKKDVRTILRILIAEWPL
jgi:hypothetical protein